MRIPEGLASLVDYGIIERVLRPLMSGKEAQIYLVHSGGEERVAKVYKEAQKRSFKQRAEYTEGRKVRNSRDQRAMSRGSRYGRSQDEAAWRATEVEVIYRLQAAGVRVPVPHHFIDGVLVMELIKDEDGLPAPRLGDLSELSRDEARGIFDELLAHVVRMLAAGVVHGDLSDFNVLMSADGPVVIDFPQAIDASSNQNARKLLIRDVDNLHRFLERFTGAGKRPPFAQEMWELFERGNLTADAKLTGRHRASERKADVKDVLGLIGDAERDERRKREALGQRMPDGRAREAEPVEQAPAASPRVGRRTMIEIAPPKAPEPAAGERTRKRRRRRSGAGGGSGGNQGAGQGEQRPARASRDGRPPAPQAQPQPREGASPSEGGPPRRRRRRRPRSPKPGSGS